jgi:hypothetical protein
MQHLSPTVTKRTTSEALFEVFCHANGIAWERIPEAETPRPDYVVWLASRPVYVEVKQLDEDADFASAGIPSTRTIGDHIRAKINEARRQVQFGASNGAPTILLVYNNIDPLQAFGTELQDFLTAMYGELTLRLERGTILESFYGRNGAFRSEKNTSFSAIGQLQRTSSGGEVTIFENIYAGIPLQYDQLPSCVRIVRVAVAESAA